MKELYIDEARRHFAIPDRRMTDSRISILTGLQRRDIRAHRDRLPSNTVLAGGHGVLPRALAAWRSDPEFRASDGLPAVLPKSSETEASFERLVQSVGRDLHPRTILDEMLRLGHVTLDAERERISLVSEGLFPNKDETMLTSYYAANLGDHAEAATLNLLASPQPGPCFERAVHYNHLSRASVATLESLSRDRMMAVLTEINAEALARQRADAGDPEATRRVRIGAYIHTEDAAADTEA